MTTLTKSESFLQKIEEQADQLTVKMLEASISVEKLKARETILAGHLAKFLDEFEGKFDSDEKCDSPEIAQDYIDAATVMQNMYGRKSNCIRKVQEWIDNYLPY